jgi:hypothetical protein
VLHVQTFNIYKDLNINGLQKKLLQVLQSVAYFSATPRLIEKEISYNFIKA